MLKLTPRKIIFIILVIIFAALYWAIKRYDLSLQTIDWDNWQNIYQQNKVLFVGLYFIGYIVVTAFSLPIATLMTLAAGAFFGLWFGLLIVSFASSIGASISFIIARYLLQESIESKYAQKTANINKRLEKEGIIYLLILRLVPIFPFFLVNLLMGLTKIPLWQFYVGSQLGMLPGTFIYVNAGSSLGSISSLSELYSPKILISIGLLVALILLTSFATKKLKKKETL